MTHGQPKKPLEVGGNPDQVALRLGLGFGGAQPFSAREDCVFD